MTITKTVVVRTMKRTHIAAWIVACFVVFAWSINFVLAKHALNQFDVGSFNFVRFSGMVAVGWFVLLATGGIRAIEPGDRLRLLIVAVVGFCGYVFGFSVGLHLTSAFSASLLLALVPLWIIVLNSLIERRFPNTVSLAALALASAGVVTFVAARTSVSLGWGDLISLVVAGFYAGYLLLNRPLINRYPPFTLITYATTLASLPVLALTMYSILGQDWSAISSTGWFAMVWVIVGPVFVAWSVWNWVQRHLDTTRIAPLLFLVPVISGYAAWLLLDEPIQLGQVVGTAAVIGGLILSHRAN
ncbi:MAG: DMT family transporter [Dehalococcoidia bacterium]|nr:DMT family transporter [Dehalococcoidia bacterium]